MKTKTKVKAKTLTKAKVKAKGLFRQAELDAAMMAPCTNLWSKLQDLVDNSGDTIDLDAIVPEFYGVTTAIMDTLVDSEDPRVAGTACTYLFTVVDDMLMAITENEDEEDKKIKILGSILPMTTHELHEFRTYIPKGRTKDYQNMCLNMGKAIINTHEANLEDARSIA